MEQNEVEETTKTKGARISLPTDAMTRTKSASGSVSYHCGDAVARALNGLNLVFVKKLAEVALGVDTSKYEHLNPGQQRMTLGNVMRNMLRRDESLYDSFNEALATIQTQHDEATAEERELAAAEKEAKQKLKDQAKLEKEQAKADREEERKQKALKREQDKQARIDEREKAKQAKLDEKQQKAEKREKDKKDRAAEKQRIADEKAEAKQKAAVDAATESAE